MGTGLKSLEQERQKKGAQVSSSELRLKGDAKIAHIRFLTDVDELEWAYFHPVLTQTRLGKKFTKEIYCMLQDDKDCIYCAQVGLDAAKVKKKIFFWVYCYGIYHLNPDAEGKWEEVEYLGEKYYIESIKAIKLLKTGPGGEGNIEMKFVNWNKRYKTLCDRDYDWSREGSTMQDTSYDLVPREEGKKEMPEEMKKLKASLMPLKKVIEQTKPTLVSNGNSSATAGMTEGRTDTEIDESLEKLF